MLYYTHNQRHIPTGHLEPISVCENLTQYDDLCALFGKPHGGDGQNQDAVWCLEFNDGLIASIYNWRTGKNYIGASGFSVDLLSGPDWVIAGNDPIVVERIHKTIRDYQREQAQKQAA